MDRKADIKTKAEGFMSDENFELSVDKLNDIAGGVYDGDDYYDTWSDSEEEYISPIASGLIRKN